MVRYILILILLFRLDTSGQILMYGSNIVGNGTSFYSLEQYHATSTLNKMNLYPTYLSPLDTVNRVIVHAVSSDGTVLLCSSPFFLARM